MARLDVERRASPGSSVVRCRQRAAHARSQKAPFAERVAPTQPRPRFHGMRRAPEVDTRPHGWPLASLVLCTWVGGGAGDARTMDRLSWVSVSEDALSHVRHLARLDSYCSRGVYSRWQACRHHRGLTCGHSPATAASSLVSRAGGRSCPRPAGLTGRRSRWAQQRPPPTRAAPSGSVPHSGRP